MSVSTSDPLSCSSNVVGAARTGVFLLAAVALIVGVSGCENPLDVDNPNNLVDEDLTKPSAVFALVNGAQGTVSRTVNALLATYSSTSDELRGVGSRDAWAQLTQGAIDDPGNEFSDTRFGLAAEARYFSDRAIRTAERFDEAGTIPDRTDLARAYLYGGMLYTYIADLYDNFVIPDSATQGAPPVGESSMVSLYDSAVSRLTNGLEVARAEGDGTWELRILAQRARSHHARGVWEKLNPSGDTPSAPLVESAEAASDAQQALQMLGDGSDWRYEFTYTPATSSGTVNEFASFQITQRGALGIGPAYAESEEGNPSRITSVILEDPIDDVPDPRLVERLNVVTSGQFAPVTVVSARELHLILAEHYLAQGLEDDFTSEINDIRVDLDGMTAYDNQIAPQAMLRHERRVNLFLQLRRLHDMYRFGATSQLWLPQSAANSTPGTFFPIAISEIRSNPQVGG